MHIHYKLVYFIILGICIFFYSCIDELEKVEFNYSDFVPSHFPMPNIISDSFPTEAKIVLGKKLFFDPIMSADSSISCSSCHNPSLSFSDNLAMSLGVNGIKGIRNAPSLANVVYQKKLLREGSLPTLEMQVLVPIQEHNEFNTNILIIVDKLNKNKDYIDLSMKAYGRKPDPYVITRSIAAFERILISGDSKYDDFINNKIELTSKELLGNELFFSQRASCSSCHSSFLFTDQTFQNNGLYDNYQDIGRMRFTGLTDDESKFKVPSLRNIELTAPYMHDGSIATLDQVIEHYNSGGKSHKNKNIIIRPLHLTVEEKDALKAFLLTLTDYKFITNKHFRNE